MRNKIFVYALCLALLNLASPQVSQAALVGTLQAVEASGTRAQDLAIVNSALAREQVRNQMAAMGVDPAAVDARVARLTDSELQSLADRMQQMPAGGDALAVIGIVFLVLIILELVGVIDIFKKT
ncbi:MAG: PA2779 family protein [Steroidobacteraceae bacterium]